MRRLREVGAGQAPNQDRTETGNFPSIRAGLVRAGMKPIVWNRTLILVLLLAVLAAPAAASLVAAAYTPVPGCTPEALDTLRSVGLNTLIVTSHGVDPDEVARVCGLAASRGMQVIWSVYYNGGPEAERGFADNERRMTLADGRRTERTPCPLDALYWQRTVGEAALKVGQLSRRVPGLVGVAFDVELYVSDAGWLGPCYGDECWREFRAAQAGRVPEVPARQRAGWLATHYLAKAFEAFQHQRVTEICAAIRRSAHKISPRLRLGALPYQDFFGDDLVRAFGTRQAPMYSLNEFTYYRRGLSPKELKIMMGLVERGLPCVPLARLLPSQQSPELTRAFAYQAGQLFGGYWLYEGLPWRDIFVERDPSRADEAKIPGSPAEWSSAVRAANEALAAARGPAPYASGWQPPSLIGYWTNAYWGSAPSRVGPGIPTGRVVELGLPLKGSPARRLVGETRFTPQGLKPGRYRVHLFLRQAARPALAVTVAGRRFGQVNATHVGPEVWRVNLGVQSVPSARSEWSVNPDLSGRLLYLACGAVFPDEWSVAGPYDAPTRDLGAVFPPDAPNFRGWKAVRADVTGFLDLASLLGKKSNALVYAALEVWSPEEREAWLLVGSDDGVRVLLDGKVVLHHDIARHASPDEEVAAVQLRAGWNRILAKVVNVGDDWGLFLRLYDGERVFPYRRAR
jgi:hypothetical protein